MSQKIDRNFFRRRCPEVARDLIGDILVRKTPERKLAGRIVETEAYLGKEDPACHYTAKGGKRDRVFEKGPGTVYVYKIHGHDCMNFICGSMEYPEGVLIRAIEPLEGAQRMMENRGVDSETEIGSGPGKLCQAMEIEKNRHNGQELPESSLSLVRDRNPELDVSSRIGISEAENWPMRFSASGNVHVSRRPDRDIDSGFDKDGFYSSLET